MATADTALREATTGFDAAARRQMMRRAVVSSAAGTTIEWCDFFLYGVALGCLPAEVLPRSDPCVATLLAFDVLRRLRARGRRGSSDTTAIEWAGRRRSSRRWC